MKDPTSKPRVFSGGMPTETRSKTGTIWREDFAEKFANRH